MNERQQLRRNKFYKTLEENALDGYLVVDPVNVSYLTGFNGEDSYLYIGDAGACLLSDTRFEQQIKEESPDVGAFIRCSGETTLGLFKQAASDKRYASKTPKRVGVEASSMTLALYNALNAEFPDIEFVPRKADVEMLRVVKDDEEVQAIRDAIDVSIDAFLDLRASLKDDATEVDIRDELEYLMRKHGGDDVSFPSIVAYDARAALPHAIPTRNGRLADASMVLIDWGAKKNGYVGDLTRTFLTEKGLNDSAESKAYRERFCMIYDIVREAHDRAIEAVKPGMMCDEIDGIARNYIKNAGYGEYFGHGLGHCIGRVVHDYGGFSPRQHVPLKSNMIVTIEPGIYLPGWGSVRIEDDVLVTETGCEVLSTRLPE